MEAQHTKWMNRLAKSTKENAFNSFALYDFLLLHENILVWLFGISFEVFLIAAGC